MKKIILFSIWILLSIIYIWQGVSIHDGFFSLRLNLWVQMIATAFVLASTGSILQILLHNPIADPWLLGISGASNLGAVIAVVAPWKPFLLWRTVFSLIGALSVVVILYFYRINTFNVQHFVLVGIGINALCSALIVFLQNFFKPEEFFLSLAGISGHFMARTVLERMLLVPSLVAVWFFLTFRNRELSILQCGEQLSSTIGVDTGRIKFEGMLVCCVALSFTVSLSGNLGFIGLAAPHIIRMLFGEKYTLDPEFILPVSGILILFAALLVRLMPNGIFISIGSAMALIGAPIFIYIIVKNTRNLTN
ncbi:MAG: FecCD family ABC transporter permease [Brevinemataceae bacterium]